MPEIKYAPWVNREKRVGQGYVHASSAEIRAVMAGRQSGKSLTGVAEICQWALERPDQILWWVTASHKTDDKAWRDLTAHLPKEVVSKTNLNDMHIVLKNGSGIWVKSAEAPDSLVSEKLHGLVGDEAGVWKSTVWYQGLLPMFNTTRLRVLFISTPRGRNWFYDLWLRGRGPGGAALPAPVTVTEEIEGEKVETTYQSFHWTSYDSPYRNLAVLAEARRTMDPDLFAQEYLAEPIENVRGVFKDVKNRIRAGLIQPTSVNWLGVDIGSAHDFTACVLLNSNREVFHVEKMLGDLVKQRERIAALALKHKARIVIDATGMGLQMAHELRAAGFPIEEVKFTNESKREVVNNLRASFANGSISIPDDFDLIDELEIYEYEILPSGVLRYSAPEGKHDDLVIALALANWGARSITMGYSEKAVTHYYLPRQGGYGVNL